MCVEGSVMQMAECESVWNDWNPEWIGVRHDVGCFEEFITLESTNRAVMPVRADNPFTELPLMQTLSKQTCHITTPYVRFF
jgi:hypothetical protein